MVRNLFLCLAWCGAMWCAMSAAPAHAQSIPDDVYVPPALEQWVPWVLAEHKVRECALLKDAYVCEWPGYLRLDVTERTGEFTLDVLVQRDGTMVQLPGGARHWPQDVQVNGAPVMVLDLSAEAPAIRMNKGRARVTGRFDWESAPEVLKLPDDVATVDLTLEQKRIDWPRIDESGQLWVKEASQAVVGEADTIRASTYRQIADSIPMSVSTLIELNVAGRAREVSLGKPLIPGAFPVNVTGDLPLQIGADGEVRVYVRPGTYEVEIISFLTEPVDALTVPKRAQEFFDPLEYWVWIPNESLRSVELSGLLTIDPSRTTLPEKWKGKTTLSAQPGQTLGLKTTRRGQPEQPPNQINLTRQIWLDLDGEGYTFRDQISGQFHQGWRLNFDRSMGALGRVKSNTLGEALLITQDIKEQGMDGVELRSATLNLEAEIRREASGELPAVGWDSDVQQLSAELMMPPGWSVFSADGVDDMQGTWVDSWDLFEFFVVLMIAFVMGKLFGWPWGVISGLALVLSHGHPDAPRYVWFHIVAVLALLRVLPHKPWLRIPAISYLAISFVVLVSLFGSYAHEQIRGGLHPQIAQSYDTSFAPGMTFGGMDNVMEGRSFEPEQDFSKSNMMEDSVVSSLSSRDSYRNQSGVKKPKNDWQPVQQQVDPKEVVQTGPGLPDWSWRSWSMVWNGPVASDHRIKLWLISPKVNLLLRILGVLCFLLMGLVVVAPGTFAPKKKVSVDVYKSLKNLMVTVMLGVFVLGSTSLVTSHDAHAQETPPATMLEDLEARLLAADKCEGACVTVSTMAMTIDEKGGFGMRAEVHAQRQSAWMLPGPATLVSVGELRVDGVPSLDLRRTSQGMVYMRLAKGRHIVELRGRLNAQNVVTLQLDPAAKPRHVSLDAKGWTVDGVDEYGRPDASLQLSRMASQTGDTPSSTKESGQELPPWYTVTRTLLLGLPWQTRTVVTRQQTDRPQFVKVSLLDGESVITEGIRVDGGEAQLTFERGSASVEYLSEMTYPTTPEATILSLKAPVDKPWSEVWHVECSRIWRCDFDGLVPIQTVDGSTYRPTWMPWPGEALEIKVRKPQGADGEAATVTQVMYRASPGERRLVATLSMNLRASQGGWQRVTLPEGAELQEVKIDGSVRSIRPEGREVSLPIAPGEHSFMLKWIQPWERGLFETFPEVKIGSKAVNVNMTMELGSNRWLLWTVGPSWGPAVLFWSHVLLLIVLAILLGRLKQLPLRTHQWLLLVLGMSQMPLVAMIPIVSWFALLVWRKEKPMENASAFALVQMFLVFWTIVTLIVLYAAVHSNLLFDVDMQVSGRGSSNSVLNWYVDRSGAELPQAGVLSVPLFVWRAAMFVWVLWIVSSLVKWLPWAWRCFGDGQLWKSLSTPRAAFDGDMPGEEVVRQEVVQEEEVVREDVASREDLSTDGDDTQE